MSEKTVKLKGWMPQAPPNKIGELEAYRQLIREVVFSLHLKKKEILKNMGMPPQPVSLREIYLEVKSRIAMLKSIKKWPHKEHGKRWIDRRVNEAACKKFYKDGIPKIVAATAGLYTVNPVLFKENDE